MSLACPVRTMHLFSARPREFLKSLSRWSRKRIFSTCFSLSQTFNIWSSLIGCYKYSTHSSPLILRPSLTAVFSRLNLLRCPQVTSNAWLWLEGLCVKFLTGKPGFPGSPLAPGMLLLTPGWPWGQNTKKSVSPVVWEDKLHKEASSCEQLPTRTQSWYQIYIFLRIIQQISDETQKEPRDKRVSDSPGCVFSSFFLFVC